MAVAPPRFRVYGLPRSVLELYRRAVWYACIDRETRKWQRRRP
jgi:hypothetical protein